MAYRTRLGICLIVALIAFVICAEFKAQHPGHNEFHDVYKEWMQPSPNETLSCCRAKKIISFPNGVTSIEGDCYPTEFRLIDGRRWIAKLDEHDSLRLKKEWIEIPDSKLIREKNPDLTGTRGHICIGSAGGVLCAVTPSGVM